MRTKLTLVERLRQLVDSAREPPVARSGAAMALRGAIDGVVDGCLVGWVSDQDHRAADRMDCTIDGEYVGSVDHFEARGDLVDLGLGDGRLAFRIALPAEYLDGRVRLARVHVFKSTSKVGSIAKRVAMPPDDATEDEQSPLHPALSGGPAIPWNWSREPRGWGPSLQVIGPTPGTEIGDGWYFDCTAGQQASFEARASINDESKFSVALVLRHHPLHGYSRITALCDRHGLLSSDALDVEIDVTLPIEAALTPSRFWFVVVGRNRRQATVVTKVPVACEGTGRRQMHAAIDRDQMTALRTNAVQFASLEVGLQLQEPFEVTLHAVRCRRRVGDSLACWPSNEERKLEASTLQAQRAAILRSRCESLAPLRARHRMDVVVPVFDAPDSVLRCLGALSAANDGTYRVLVVDDGSGVRTARLLDRLSASCPDLVLLTHRTNRGYTATVNHGLGLTEAPFVTIINSDAVVPMGWQHRLLAAFYASSRVGITGPLSNAASWQSVPIRTSSSGDWMVNDIPGGDLEAFQRWLRSAWVARYPRVPLLNGFCLCVRREVLDDVGGFDETTFPIGYGEENDYCVRTQKAGWELRCADDLYVFHEKSRSFRGRRAVLSTNANASLQRKHPDVDWAAFASELRDQDDLHELRELMMAQYYGR